MSNYYFILDRTNAEHVLSKYGLRVGGDIQYVLGICLLESRLTDLHVTHTCYTS